MYVTVSASMPKNGINGFIGMPIFSSTHYPINTLPVWLDQYTLSAALEQSSSYSTFSQALGIVFFIFPTLVGVNGIISYFPDE